MKLGIVVADFNAEITHEMVEVAEAHAEKKGVTITKIINVPGAYDMPIAVQKLLKDNEVEGVITLAAIVKGGTKHDEVIANTTAKSLTELSLKFNKPVVLGIMGPGCTYEQAAERKKEYAQRAVDAAIELLHQLE